MKKCILILSTGLLVIVTWQKWPIPAHQLAPAHTQMPPIPPHARQTIDSTHLHAFYHSHRSGEAGHFHIFFTDADRSFSRHIIGASIDNKGQLIKLFVTAPWVTHDDDLLAPELLHELSQAVSPTWIHMLVQKHLTDIEELLNFTHKLAKPCFGRYEIMAEKALFPL